MITGAAALTLSRGARAWVKVKLAKHLFEHRYDYRTEWLRFTNTLGHSGPDAPPLGDRIVKAFADIAEAPGGLLLETDAGDRSAQRRPGTGPEPTRPKAKWSRTSASGPKSKAGDGSSSSRAFATAGEARGSLTHGAQWMLDESCVWAGIPLIHHDRLVGIVLLAAPEYRRALDWEDFDLLRTAGRQAASSLAEAHARRRYPTLNGSRNSTAASPSSCTTSKTSSASSRCCHVTPSATPTIPSSGRTWLPL